MLVAGFVLPLLRSQLSLELAEALHLIASVLQEHCGSLPSHTTRTQYDRHLCFPCWQLQNSQKDWSSSLSYLKVIMAACLCYTLILSLDISFCKIDLGRQDSGQKQETGKHAPSNSALYNHIEQQ